ncbi:MAG: M13 family metallopeptidase, partial [Muribaculaceae bacterium]|nr:M13 family metallopeptidase [Muribaculaceae bacterium]
STQRTADGVKPLKPYIEKIENFDPAKLAEMMGFLQNGLTTSFFSVGVGADYNNADMNILHIGETGLGLGDRDYYLVESEENANILKEYEKYMKRIMSLSGYSVEEAERIWNNVIKIERDIALNKMTREEKRQPQLRNNVMSYEELKSKFPNIDWDTFFATLELPELDKVNVGSVKYLTWLNDYLPTLTERQIKDMMLYDLIGDSSNLLGDEFELANFEFYDKILSGKEEQEPRWKRAMTIPNSMFGEAIGQLYVERYFPEENKQAMLELVNNLKTALGQHIDSLTWMSPETKAKAHEKLATFRVKIGYPDKWKDYSGIEIDPAKSYMENVYEASKWYRRDNLNDLGKPVDREEWLMTPQTVNAYYMPTTNEICFPAAILQAPYFDKDADDALNYGAIGVVIGHEMTHGFDDSGRKFDKDGNLADWWQEGDAEKFSALADGLAAQFDAVEVLPGVNANGRFTLGENIADQGGLRVAMTAYKNAVEGSQPEIIDGFTPEQRFYIAYANLWANNIRNEEIARLTKMDPHSLGRNRVNVSLRNIKEFIDAFGLKEGDAMYRPENERLIIW